MGNNFDNLSNISHNGKRRTGINMRIISRSTLRGFWEQHKYRDSEQQLRAWFDETKKAKWQTPQDIKDKYSNASFIDDNRVIFNIKGGNYRLIVKIDYSKSIVYIRFVGTHKQYDEIDPSKI